MRAFLTTLLVIAACVRGTRETATVPQVDPLAERPPVGAVPAFNATVPERFALSSGAEVWLVQQDDLPLVSLRLVVPGGSALDPIEKPGLTSLTDAMLTHGAGSRDAAAFAKAVEQQAFTLGARADGTASVVYLDAHAARLDEGLALMADAVLRPRFEASELDRVRELRLGTIAESLDDPPTVAAWVADRELFGKSHPLGHAPLGTDWGVKAIVAEDLKASWSRRYAPKGATFVVAGAIDAATLKTALEKHFGAWSAANTAPPPIAFTAPTAQRALFIDNPGASQSVLRVLMPGWTAGSPEVDDARLGVVVLGGTFTSRLNRLLREEKGYTYGVRARLDAGAELGLVTVATSVVRESTAPALVDLLGELNRIRAGITAEELEKARGARRTALVASMEGRASVADTFASYEVRGLEPDALKRELEALDAASVESVNAAIQALPLDSALIVVMGDLASVRADVEKAVPHTWTVVAR